MHVPKLSVVQRVCNLEMQQVFHLFEWLCVYCSVTRLTIAPSFLSFFCFSTFLVGADGHTFNYTAINRTAAARVRLRQYVRSCYIDGRASVCL